MVKLDADISDTLNKCRLAEAVLQCNDSIKIVNCLANCFYAI